MARTGRVNRRLVLALLLCATTAVSADDDDDQPKKPSASPAAVVANPGEAPAGGQAAPDAQPFGVGKPWYTPISTDGYIAARFSAIAPDYSGSRPAIASGVTLVRHGNAIGYGKIGPGGVAQVGGVREGLQGVWANGEDGFAAFGTYASREVGPSLPVELPYIDVGMIPLQDVPLVRNLIAQAGSGSTVGFGTAVPQERFPAVGFQKQPQLTISADGHIQGEMLVPGKEQVFSVPDMTITLIRNGREIARGQTDALGYFHLPADHVSPGFVSLVAHGPHGFAAMAVLVELPNEVAAVAADGAQYVVFDDKPKSRCVITPITGGNPRGMMNALGAGANGGGGFGGFGGGGFGGGGGGVGGGGGGGLGAILAGLGGAALGAALNDGGGSNVVSPPGP